MTRFLTFLFLLLSISAFAQPQNDDCGGIIDLGEAPFCPDNVFYSNVGATASEIGQWTNIPACLSSGNSPRDVWFQFTASTDPNITDYEITITGMDDSTGSTPLNTPQVVLFRGFCIPDELIIMDCIEANAGENSAVIKIDGLTPGATYFLRIGDYSAGAPNSGTFKICVEEKAPDVLISEGGSTKCSGILYDSGGPDGDYGANENYVFTICPQDFNNCISFNLEYYNLEADNFNKYDQIFLYDGPDINSPVISTIGDFDYQYDGANNQGGVCYQVYASSGCLTVQFISDGDVQFEGFKASWQCATENCPSLDAITVDADADTTTLLNYLNTPYATTTIDTIICDNGAYGAFEASNNSGLGIQRGIILTTGSAANAVGPNQSNSTSETLLLPGDDDLDALSALLGNNNDSEDACVVELSVFAYADKLSFEYIFGSEEYREFVGGSYNDIFAFFVSGPGIIGEPTLNNQQNIAVIPNTMTPVQINSVNHRDNWQYYRNNEIGDQGQIDGLIGVEYDGLTTDSMGIKKSLTASIDVIPCNTYKLKLAIADRGDAAFDSGVFISEIKAGSPEISGDFKSGLDYLVEKCVTSNEIILIELDDEITEPITYTLSLTGDAMNGIDYTLALPNSLTFTPTETSFSFPISVIDDNIIEGTEKIIISLSHDFGCGEVTFDDLVIDLKDNIDVQVLLPNDTLEVCNTATVQLQATGAALYLWTPAAIFDDPSTSNPIASPTTSGWVFVTGIAGICQDKDSVYLNLVDVQVNITASDTEICQGDTVQLSANATIADVAYNWQPFFSFNDPTLQNQEIVPFFTNQYIVSIEKYGCMVSDTVIIQVDQFIEPTVIGDTTICQSQSVKLADDVQISTTTYEWNPSSTLNQSDISDPIATPNVGTTGYTLTSTSENGFCSTQQTVLVTVLPALLNIVEVPSMNNVDTIFLCAPDSTKLLAQNSTDGVGLSWLPNNGTLSSPTDSLVTAKPKISGLYIATLDIGACALHDSVYLQIDSLPKSPLQAVPFKDPYCPGDTVSLFSQGYKLDDYPNITHEWTPMSELLSDANNFNLVVLTQDTIVYTRTTTNGACTDKETITLNVDKPANITVTQDKMSICRGEEVQLNATSPDGDEFEWSPESGLSCTECPNPIAIPNSTITYEVKLKNQNCPASETATIIIKDTPTIQFPADNNLCPGESITLNESNNPAYTYSWTSDDPNFTATTDPQPTVTPNQTYTYTVDISNGDCTATESITVHVADDNVTIESPDGICPGFPILLSAVTNGSGSFVWMPDNLEGQNITVEPTTPTTYTVTYTYGDGCVLTASKNIVVYPYYTVLLTAEKDTVYATETINISASVSPALSDPVFKWTQNGNIVGGSGSTLSVKASDGPIDNFTATLITPEGCEYTPNIQIVVLPIKYEMPNAFTPNGDGINETFRPAIIEGYEFERLQVFNRWGNLIYEGTSPFKGWDGTFKEREMPPDAYPFAMRLKLPDGRIKLVKGDVTLLR